MVSVMVYSQKRRGTMKTAVSLTFCAVLLAASVVQAADRGRIPASQPRTQPPARPGVAENKGKPDITEARKGLFIGGAVGGAGGKFVPWGAAADISDVAPLPGTIAKDRCAFNVTYFETNIGTADTSPLYTNKLKLDGAAEVAVNTNRQLNAGQTKSVTTQPYLSTGGHGLELSLDAGLVVGEANEGNNVFSIRYKLASCCDGLPDLVPVIPNPMNGAMAVKNSGSCPAGPSKLLAKCVKEGHTGGGGGCADIPTRCAGMYSDPAFPDAFVLAVPALAPGATYNHTFACWAEMTWLPGRYNFTFRADAASAVPESNEGNNTATSTLTVP